MSSSNGNAQFPLNGTFSLMLSNAPGGHSPPLQMSPNKMGPSPPNHHFPLQSPPAAAQRPQNDSPPPQLIAAIPISSPRSGPQFSFPPASHSPASNSPLPISPPKCQPNILQSFLAMIGQNGPPPNSASAISLLQQLAQQAESQNRPNPPEIPQKSSPPAALQIGQQMQLFAAPTLPIVPSGAIPSPIEAPQNNGQIGPSPPFFLTEALKEAIAAAIQQQQNIGTHQIGKEMGEEMAANGNNADFGLPLPPILGPSLSAQMPPASSSSSSSAPIGPSPPPPAQPMPPLANSSTQNSNRPIRSQRAPMKEIITLDDPNELDEFMANGEEQCIQDMRAFITQFSLRQTTVAMMTGVSQPYISKLLNGNHRELSLRCRKNIYCWYLNCRRHPEKLALFVQDQPISRLETTVDGELVPQRRERYVFRPVLIRILETYFQDSPFPDTAKRAEIANACNSNLQLDKKGNQLMPKEVVTPQVVANWFANKRKEMRRKSQRSGGANHRAMGQQQNMFGHAHQIAGDSVGGGSSSAASCSSSLSPSPPNSATFGQSTFFNGLEQQSNLTALLEEMQNQQQMGSGAGKSVEEILMAGKQNLLLQNLLMQQNVHQKPLLSLADCAPLLPLPNPPAPLQSPLLLPHPLQSAPTPPGNGLSLLEQFLLLQNQQNALGLFPPALPVSSPSTLVDPAQLAALQLAAAAAFINQPPAAAIAPNLDSTGSSHSAIQAAKLMENTAQWAAQNPQLLANLERTI